MLYNVHVVQLYFLSIVFNALSGFALLTGDDEEGGSGIDFLFFKNPVTSLVLGVVTILIGVLKLLTVLPGDIPILGDIVPAGASFASGAALLYAYYKSVTPTAPSLPPHPFPVFLTNRKIVGIVSVVAAVLHFLFPTALLL
jgi:hypothetical protein